MDESVSQHDTLTQEFLKTFRIALNFITLYSKDHKSFVASIGEVKTYLDRLLAGSSTVTILFSSDALSVNGTTFEKKQVYLDLAKQFHFRKVKSLLISAGVTLQELSSLMEIISLPVKDVIGRGGVGHLLAGANVVSIRVEELDYSALLRDEGVEADVGAYLLNQSMIGEDPAKIREFSQHFESAISHVSVRAIAEDKQLGTNLHNFLAYIQTSDNVAFHECIQSLFRVVLKDKTPATPEQMSAFSDLVKGLSADVIAGVIVDEASRNDEFNNENLALFLKELDTVNLDAVNASLANTITEQDPAQRMSPKASRKLKDLFTVSEAPLVSGIYNRVMETLSRNISSEAAITFDRDAAQRNYRAILLFILGFEQEDERLDAAAEKLCGEWQAVVQDPGAEYFTALAAALENRRERLSSLGFLAQLDLLFRRLVEESAFRDDVPEWMDGLIGALQESTRDERWYFEKMFAGEIITRRTLSLFLRLFPEHTERLCGHLEQSSGDIEFIGAVVGELAHVDSPQTNIILEKIYGFSNDLIKIEVLKAMAGLPEIDEGFLLPLLSQENVLLRKEAMAVLAHREQSRDKALDFLLRDDDMWGRKNTAIEENIGIVEELRVEGAGPYLDRIARKPFFWNTTVRRRAQKALEALS